MRLAARGHLCPVCIRPARAGTCDEHGTWKAHQLMTTTDRRRCGRRRWQPFQPAAQACPRCLGEVAESRTGDSTAAAALVDGYGAAFTVAAGLVVAALIVAAVVLRGRGAEPAVAGEPAVARG